MDEAGLMEWRAKRIGKVVPVGTVASDDAPSPFKTPSEAQAKSPLDGQDLSFGRDTLTSTERNGDVQPQAPAAPTPPAESDEVKRLRAELDSALGRVAPTQKQIEELTAANRAAMQRLAEYESNIRERDELERKEKSRRAAEDFDPFEGFSEDEVNLLDPTAANLIRKAARNAYVKASAGNKDPEELINAALAKRDQVSLGNFLRAAADSLGLVSLQNDDAFNSFLREDDSAAILLENFVRAPTIDAARGLEPKVRNMLKRFEKTVGVTTATQKKPDPQEMLSAHLDRNGQPSGQNRSKSITPEEARRIANQSKALTRAGKHKEARDLLAQINY
jgi:hypothetical protein